MCKGSGVLGAFDSRVPPLLFTKVTLVAVSKTKEEADIMEAYEAGHRDFGENYVRGKGGSFKVDFYAMTGFPDCPIFVPFFIIVGSRVGCQGRKGQKALRFLPSCGLHLMNELS